MINRLNVARSLLAVGGVIRTFAAMFCAGVLGYHYAQDVEEKPLFLLIIPAALILLCIVFGLTIWAHNVIEKRIDVKENR